VRSSVCTTVRECDTSARKVYWSLAEFLVKLVAGELDIQLGGAQQETGCYGLNVPGQPEAMHFDEFLNDVGRADQD